jgi:hypothetical protein
MLFVGLFLPIPVGYLVIGWRHADVPLSLFGLTSLPLLVWGASLGASIGPCGVPSCVSHTEHSRLVISIAALVILVVAFVLLGLQRFWPGGIVLVVAELVGAYSMIKTDTAIVITLLILAGSAVGYLIYRSMDELEESRVPDFPPSS